MPFPSAGCQLVAPSAPIREDVLSTARLTPACCLCVALRTAQSHQHALLQLLCLFILWDENVLTEGEFLVQVHELRDASTSQEAAQQSISSLQQEKQELTELLSSANVELTQLRAAADQADSRLSDLQQVCLAVVLHFPSVRCIQDANYNPKNYILNPKLYPSPEQANVYAIPHPQAARALVAQARQPLTALCMTELRGAAADSSQP